VQVEKEIADAQDSDMADFSEHDLIMIKRWQRLNGSNQRKQGGLTPPQEGTIKASPLNKKKKKSSGVLFPSPKDTHTHSAMHIDIAELPGNAAPRTEPNVEADTAMGEKHDSKEAEFQALH
jgi:hypothetical protein